ncbi:conserved hypothetical protein [Hahella chejuensis KCTC 2396]|uniref:Uncharacterized protein n=1 Tax=Hahella chejuensis (strain KCTC 2396) TaxID=349521 RepID=Q2SLL4_HAHCH|nr:hypothetical protein [Hahella chejuensis]ABC28460.1 conserved hypothetical protein [Hahella chejuensis KCTC 2396]
MKNKILSLTRTSVLLAAAAFSAHSLADCQALARTDMERLYCEIQDKGEGASLPKLEDFRRNDRQIQALLLKRPAAKLGLSLPGAGKSQKPRKAESTVGTTPATATNNISRSEPKADVQQAPRSSAPATNDCLLYKDQITCGSHQFHLATNKQNKFLKQGALAEDNKLNLPSFQGDPANEPAVKDYLSQAYRVYIPKMLEIGLGDATMSFTKFYYSFKDIQKQNLSFSDRFETMYGFLKRDKSAMAIQPRYSKELPSDINQCNGLSDAIIVCDNGATNWVYVRQS